jgi:hypothetical protein
MSDQRERIIITVCLVVLVIVLAVKAMKRCHSHFGVTTTTTTTTAPAPAEVIHPLSALLVDNNTFSYTKDPVLKGKILEILKIIKTEFETHATYAESVLTGKIRGPDVAGVLMGKITRARMLIFGTRDIFDSTGTRVTRKDLVAPAMYPLTTDLANKTVPPPFNRITYKDKKYSFTVDQLYPYMPQGVPHKDDDADINAMIFGCAPGTTNCESRLFKCDVVNNPVSPLQPGILGEQEAFKCDKKGIYHTYDLLEKAYTATMARFVGDARKGGIYVTGGAVPTTCANSKMVTGVNMADSVVTCPSTHESIYGNRCIKNGVSYVGDSYDGNCTTSCRTGYYHPKGSCKCKAHGETAIPYCGAYLRGDVKHKVKYIYEPTGLDKTVADWNADLKLKSYTTDYLLKSPTRPGAVILPSGLRAWGRVA